MRCARGRGVGNGSNGDDEPLQQPLGMPPVVRALEGVGLQVYAGVFEDLGYDDLRYLLGMDAAERAQVAERLVVVVAATADVKAPLQALEDKAACDPGHATCGL